MKKLKDDFLLYQTQTSPTPLGLEVTYAKGNYIYDIYHKKYLDFVAGVSSCNLGHCHPKVAKALKAQIKKYLHVMVYGEYVQENTVKYVTLLAKYLPENLQNIYLTNSGTEAIEGALKLAKRVTGRQEIIAAKNAYHGSTQGALSILGIESQKSAFRPLIPKIKFINYNEIKEISKITHYTAAVVLETIQGGAGFICPENNYLNKIKKRCQEVGCLLILDEIQTGFGRTGKLFGFENFNVIPDILVIGKAMANGMPVGAFCSSVFFMKKLQTQPSLGHITTFGGNAVIAAACLATLQELLKTPFIKEISEKEKLFRNYLKHKKIRQINGKGLMLAMILATEEEAKKTILEAIKKGLILFGLLWEKRAVRISPPLTITKKEIKKGCEIIIGILNEMDKVIK